MVAAALVAGCGDDEPAGNTPTNLLVGTWIARNAETPAGDAITEGGMSLVATIGDAGTYAFNITNDQLGLCNPGPDCNVSGSFTHTDNTVTIDFNGTDATVSYAVTGDIMTWIGTIDGEQVAITFNRIV
ncbi:MAG TPA: hypothetical protein VJU15_08345 [Gemmatimonadales bacterium]|nr:hypothetical protein [Gemmatimonadales bacterium]